MTIKWIRPWTFNHKGSRLNGHAAAVMPLGKALYHFCPVPQIGLKAIGPVTAYLQAVCFLSGQVKRNSKLNSFQYQILK